MNNFIRFPILLFSILILIGCGPSGPSANEKTIAKWTSAVSYYETMKDTLPGVEMYITSDGKGVVLKESQYEQIGLVGFQLLYPELGIPDYIIERISNTAPIDGNQNDSYDNVKIYWSIDRSNATPSLGSFYSEVQVYVNLRLAD